MKNTRNYNGLFTLFLSAMLLIVLTLFDSCKHESRQDSDDTDGGGHEEQDQGREVTPPKETITLERAHLLFQTYQERFRVLSELKGSTEASYGWHSIEFYKDYIKYLEKASRKVKIKVTGLRLYFVAYPEDDDMGDAGYQTYMYVPTYYNEKKKAHIAFDPLYLDENGEPIPIHDIILNGTEKYPGLSENKISDKMQVELASMRKALIGESSIANYSQMCEPHCKE